MYQLFRIAPLLVTALLSAVSPSIAQPAPQANPSAAASDNASPAFPAITVASKSDVVVPDLPYGMCALDPQQDADRAAVTDMHLAAQGPSKLLGVYANCTELAELRKSSSGIKFLSHYATLVEQDGAKVSLNRASTLLVLSSATGITSAFSTQATQATKAGFGTRRASYHGILKQTPDYLIVGSEQRHLAKTQEYAVSVVSLVTVIKGKVVTANFFGSAENDQSFIDLGNHAEAYGVQLIAVNP